MFCYLSAVFRVPLAFQPLEDLLDVVLVVDEGPEVPPILATQEHDKGFAGLAATGEAYRKGLATDEAARSLSIRMRIGPAHGRPSISRNRLQSE